MRRFLLSSAVLMALFSACGDGSNNNSSGTTAGVQQVVTPTPLSPAVVQAMNTAIQGEYMNEQIYRRVIQDFGKVQPFFNIAFAEVRHSDSLAALFELHAFDVPVSQWNSENVPRYPSTKAACQSAVKLEQQTIARYNEWLSTLDLPADVAQVFTRLRDASRNQHLPAFEACS